MDTKQLTKVAENLPVDGIAVLKQIAEAWSETLKTGKEIAEINAKKEIVIEDIKQRYATYNNLFAYIFSERDKVISKNFEIIDKGIAENNDALISMGLNELYKVITTSPFMNFNDFKKQLNSGDSFEL